MSSTPGRQGSLRRSIEHRPVLQTQRMVIVITGPIASGKSTVARALARELERVDVHSAVIDLDHVYDMLVANGSISDDATWMLARRGVATLANTFLEEGVATDFVIDTERVTATSAAAAIAGLTRRALD
jgi:adenylylsulfate kinase-like enzyme